MKFTGGTKIDLIMNDKPFMTCFGSIFQKNVDVLHIKSIINNYRDDTTGCDRMTVKILESISKLIVKPLENIYNLSIPNRIFLDNFKLAFIKPLFMVRDEKNMSNCRLISMLKNFRLNIM